VEGVCQGKGGRHRRVREAGEIGMAWGGGMAKAGGPGTAHRLARRSSQRSPCGCRAGPFAPVFLVAPVSWWHSWRHRPRGGGSEAPDWPVSPPPPCDIDLKSKKTESGKGDNPLLCGCRGETRRKLDPRHAPREKDKARAKRRGGTARSARMWSDDDAPPPSLKKHSPFGPSHHASHPPRLLHAPHS
jgi:hypothetical protein